MQDNSFTVKLDDVTLPLIDVWQRLEPQQRACIEAAVPGGAENVQDIYPLAPLQEGMLFHHLMNDWPDSYVLLTFFELQSRAYFEPLIAALQCVVNRHDVLRTGVFWEKLPAPLQVVYRKVALPVREVTVQGAATAIKQLQEHAKSGQSRFNVQQAPLVKLLLADDPQTERCHAVLVAHHLICDHQSLMLLVEEALACLNGHGQELPAPTPFKDYVTRSLAAAEAEESAAFFKSRLADIDETTAPFGLVDIRGDGSQIIEHKLLLDDELERQIRVQAERHGATPARLFHAAWGLVVAHTSGRDDVVYGTVLLAEEQRTNVGRAQRLLGPYINTLPLRLKLHDVSAQDLIHQTKGEIATLLKHEAAPLTLAQQCSGVGLAPLFTSLFNFRRGTPQPQGDHDPAAAVRVLGRIGARTNYPITISVTDLGAGAGFELTASTDRRIDPSRVCGYLKKAMDSLALALECAPESRALSLSILPGHERHEVIERFNLTEVDFPKEQALHRIFEQWVERSHGAPAAADETESLTYGELNRRANRLARYLRRQGADAGDYIPVVMSRSLPMLVAQVAVLKSGCVYVPMDPELPVERLSFMIRDCNAPVILAISSKPEALAIEAARWLDCAAAAEEIEREDPTNLPLPAAAIAPAYVMYTSGSTGLPKGVVVPHHAVSRLVVNCDYLAIQRDDCFAHYSNPSFDASTLEVWGALLNGARMVIVPRAAVLDAQSFGEVLQRHRVTTVYMSVGLFNQYAEALAGIFPYLRYLLVGGDALDPTTIRRVLRESPPQHLLNCYGPTEGTTFSATHLITEVPDGATSIPIGRPIANTRTYILDRARQPVPIGVCGELYIGGAGVACGYLNRPELTEERFVTDLFCLEPDARMYKTGDQCRWRADGVIEYLGRNDHQVKIRGFRVELGEVEAHLARHAGVKETVVLARQDESKEKQLVAYLTVRDPAHAPGVEELRTCLRRVLPDYMIPSAFVILAQMPLTPTGKVDRRSLPSPSQSAFSTRQYKPPVGEMEQEVAAIWQQLLRVERVGRDDDFFALGGHSLLVLKAVSQINRTFHTTLRVRDLYAQPKVKDMALRIGGEVAEHEFVDLSVEAVLPPEITPLDGTRVAAPEHILLTGATGFVGRFLLARLLKETDATIHCMVRATPVHEAAIQLRRRLASWDLWQDEFEHRIVATPGDLTRPRLGASENAYLRLCSSIDTIYHCATSMNHLETYAMARTANVAGTRELLKIATLHRPKVVNYISTASIFSRLTASGVRRVDETTSIDQENHSAANGYAASKWVGEKLTLLAAERGVPCNVFRLGLIWADTQQGRYDPLQQGHRILESCLASGYGIEDFRYSMPPTPVDYAARAIVYLANRHVDGRRIFHISSPGQMLAGVFERCNAVAGTSLELLPLYDWIQRIRRLHESGRSLSVVPLFEFAFHMDEASFGEHQRMLETRRVEFDSQRTRDELDRVGIVAPMLNDSLLRLCISRIQATLERPQRGSVWRSSRAVNEATTGSCATE